MDELTPPTSINRRSVWLKAVGLTTLFSILLILISVGGLSLYAWNYLTKITDSTQLSPQDLLKLTTHAWQQADQPNLAPTTFLILGTDEVANRANQPALTDTMMLVSVNSLAGEIKVIALPRDLWSEQYQTRINALYFYGQDRNPTQPTEFPEAVIKDMTGQDIDHTIVISLAQLGELIDIVGGVQLTVPAGFTDDAFPRSDVDISRETDPAKLYQTISFAPGEQILNGERALQYIRSRHSQDLSQGTDLARSARQQQVLSALLLQLTQPRRYLDSNQVNQLLIWYLKNIQPQLELEETMMLGLRFLRSAQPLQLTAISVPVFPDSDQGIIFHPPLNQTNGQWVYAITNKTAFREFFANQLKTQTK